MKIPLYRSTVLLAFLIPAGLAPLCGQTADSATTSGTPSNDQVVEMSAFEVRTTQGHGYSETNAVSALKTNENIMDLPQSILVVTNDLVRDIAAHGTTDTLQFVGVANSQAYLDFPEIGGQGTGYPYIDDMPDNQSFTDNAFVDSYAIVKGPTQFLYVNASETGVIIMTTKKPLPYNQDIFTARINDWGQYRFTLDATGPIGKIGDAKVGYRMVAWDQGGGYWAQNCVDDRKGLFVAAETDYHDAIVRFDWYHQNIIAQTNSNGIITPTGNVYMPNGRDFIGQVPNTMIEHPTNRFAFHWLQKISEAWETKFQASFWNLQYYGPLWNSSSVNWATPIPTVNPLVRNDNYRYQYWTVMQDAHGSYRIGPISNQDAIGFAYTEYTAKSEGTGWPQSASFNGTPYTEAAYDAIVAPQTVQYPEPANLGTYSKTVWTEIYWQHSVEVIPKWLTLIAGWTWNSDVENSVANVSTLPYLDVYNPQEIFVHRLAAVLKIFKDVSIYGLDETSYAPASGSALLINGQLEPGTFETETEVGVKTDFLGGRISTDFRWFIEPINTTYVVSPTLSPITGQSYYINTGQGHVTEGVDGDVTFTVVKNFQLIGSIYAGHSRQSNGDPVSDTYDNMWSFYARYDFDHSSPLKGLALGGGMSRIGGRWIADNAILAFPSGFTPPPLAAIKLQAGTLVDMFVSYDFNKYVSVRVGVDNLLNEEYVAGDESAAEIDPMFPQTWSLSVTAKF